MARVSYLILLVFTLPLLHCFAKRVRPLQDDGEGQKVAQPGYVEEGEILAPNEIVLHVYDVADHGAIRAVNAIFGKMGLGAWHIGIEVYGKEWMFGYHPFENGVLHHRPMGNTAHPYAFSYKLGRTRFSQFEAETMIEAIRPDWPGNSYDLTGRNCGHFAKAVAEELDVPFPYWGTALANVGYGLGVVIGGAVSGSVKSVGASQRGSEVASQASRAVAQATSGRPFAVGDHVLIRGFDAFKGVVMAAPRESQGMYDVAVIPKGVHRGGIMGTLMKFPHEDLTLMVMERPSEIRPGPLLRPL